MGMGEVKGWAREKGVRKRMNHRAQDAHFGSSIDPDIVFRSVVTAPSTKLAEIAGKKRQGSSLGYSRCRAHFIIGRSQLGQRGTRH